MVSRAAGRPAYLQVADALREQVTSQEFSPGTKLPSERELMTAEGVPRAPFGWHGDQLRAGAWSSPRGLTGVTSANDRPPPSPD